MNVARARQPEFRLEPALRGRRLEQIITAHDLVDRLRSVVYDDRELIRESAILPRDDEKAADLTALTISISLLLSLLLMAALSMGHFGFGMPASGANRLTHGRLGDRRAFVRSAQRSLERLCRAVAPSLRDTSAG